jgi:hypothetical protein
VSLPIPTHHNPINRYFYDLIDPTTPQPSPAESSAEYSSSSLSSSSAFFFIAAPVNPNHQKGTRLISSTTKETSQRPPSNSHNISSQNHSWRPHLPPPVAPAPSQKTGPSEASLQARTSDPTRVHLSPVPGPRRGTTSAQSGLLQTRVQGRALWG